MIKAHNVQILDVKFIRWYFLLITFCYACFTATSAKFEFEGNVYKTLSDSTVKLVKWNNTQPYAIVPATVTNKGKTYIVREIYNSAIISDNITSLSFPTTISKFDAYAVMYCHNLTEISFRNYFSNNAKELSMFNNAISYNPRLLSINFPDIPVRQFKTRGFAGNGAIYDCPSLVEVSFVGDVWSNDGHPLFRKCPKLSKVIFGNKNPKEIAFAFPDDCPFIQNEMPKILRMTDEQYMSYVGSNSSNSHATTAEATTPDIIPPVTPASSQTIQNIDVAISDVDSDIPVSLIKSPSTFAVIIGNENYSYVSPVDYAVNDATSFANYCKLTLGIPEKNVRFYKNATSLNLRKALRDMKAISVAYEGELDVLFYYAGHGVPDENRETYILPVDAESNDLDFCMSTNDLYKSLNELNAKSVLVFLDACFTGSKRGNGMLENVRGVEILPKKCEPQGKMIVFSAASETQSAYPYRSQCHGLFTYSLLLAIKRTAGEITLGSLADEISKSVMQTSIVENGRSQTPSVQASASLANSWRKMPLKR